MALNQAYKTYVAELLVAFGPVKIKSMFGGGGIFAPLPGGDLMFGLIAEETVYLKVGERNRADFEEHGCSAFSYQGKNGKRSVMSYYQLPAFLYDDPETLATWARKALDVALKAKTPKRGDTARQKRTG